MIPNEHSRVILPNYEGDSLSSYINANYIRGYEVEACAYIATQGPMAHTIVDFWRMVWHEKSPIIVMITKLKEKNQSKCENYLPEKIGGYGDIEVTVDKVAQRPGYLMHFLTLRCKGEAHKVVHYWYTAWPDHKPPDSPKMILDLVREVELRRYKDDGVTPKGPITVHCSAGIGRTGCFIAISIGIRQLREEHSVDVLGIVCSMRMDRGGMIQTHEQYEFIHQALCEYEKMLDAGGD
ncbi:PTPRR [Acanthosepion pharaonis]|uniref:protein-tyrosine-phosphatase n=1 Tax=Acanthosepion pharaonis TaxID=158019 RepID=A0A812CE29_ACAPH|nr:PTPRR [Sepia pharaonis]